MTSAAPAAARTSASQSACRWGSLSRLLSGSESSRLHPTAPASSNRSTNSLAGSPYPASMSALTGTSTARVIRPTAANISATGVPCPSG